VLFSLNQQGKEDHHNGKKELRKKIQLSFLVPKLLLGNAAPEAPAYLHNMKNWSFREKGSQARAWEQESTIPTL
jgi:hypothetical protein